MSAKMKRRRRQERRKRIAIERRHWREHAAFFATGAFPASAVACAVCPCGARAFSRSGSGDHLGDFWDQHTFCDDVAELSA